MPGTPHFDLPTIAYFLSGNPYSGSFQNFNYKIQPGQMLEVSVWYGKLCEAKSEIAAQQQFSMDGDGIEKLLAWLEQMFEKKQ